MTLSQTCNTEPGRVELKICSPHQPVRLVTARLTGQIMALQTLWPAPARKRFIFNGVELLESNTFESYGIKDGDSIIALPADQTDSIITTHQWLNLTRDSDTFNDCMRWMLDPRTSGEAARLRDLHRMKMARRPKLFMRMCAPFVGEETRSNSLPAANTSYANATGPSTAALPVAW